MSAECPLTVPRDVFEQGKQRAPRIIFIDQIDAAVAGRDLSKRDRVVIPGRRDAARSVAASTHSVRLRGR